MFMINLRGLIILSLFLPRAARRSFRIGDSRHDAQQQNKMLTKDFEVSADGKDAFVPTGLKKMLLPNAKKILPQKDASPRFPSATMNMRYGRWSPGYDYYDGDWGYDMDGYGRYGGYGMGGYGGYGMGGYGGYGMGGYGRYGGYGMGGYGGYGMGGYGGYGMGGYGRYGGYGMGGYGGYGGYMGGYGRYGRRAYDPYMSAKPQAKLKSEDVDVEGKDLPGVSALTNK